MKKIIAIIMTMAILVSSVGILSASAAIKGDADENGNVTAIDARKVLLAAAGKETVSAEKFALYDMDGNGSITAIDARTVLRIAAGLLEETPVFDEKEFEKQVAEKEKFIEKEFLKLVNEERQKQGVGQLTVNNALYKGARVRAMECTEVFSHTRPNGESFYSVLQGDMYYNWYTVGENIGMSARGYYEKEDILTVYTEEKLKEVALTLFTGFKNSPGHYENMINGSFKETGFGVILYHNAEDDMIYAVCAHIFGAQK